MTSRPPAQNPQPTSLWHASLRGTTVGSLVLVLLSAFEAMAVTTVMQTVADDLDGQALYSVAFSATLAASVIAMVVSGRWSDRSGPVGPLLTAVGFFLAGLIVAGTAINMPILVVGRFLQGLGGGAITVTLYVVVARRYPPALHPKVFGMFSAAWVVPSMIGPFLAGVISDYVSWHWVFLGVAIFVLPALLLLVPSLKAVRGPAPGSEEPLEDDADIDANQKVRTGVAVSLSVVVAVGLVIAGSFAEAQPGPIVWAGALAIFLVVAMAARKLLPTGTLRVRRGLPATILMRGTMAAAYFGTEVYLPKMLQSEYHMSASMAGLVLTVGAVSWSVGSAIQARLDQRVKTERLLVLGAAIVATAIAVQLVSALASLGPIVAMLGWLIGGMGMGLSFPRVSTSMLAFSTPHDQGFNSAALSISDSIGGATATAVTGLVFVAVGSGLGAFAACFGFCLGIAVFNIFVATRAGGAPGRVSATDIVG